jgi:hypothetical protein
MMRFRSKGAKLLRKGHRRLPAKALEAHNRELAPGPRKDRKNFWHLEAQLSFSRDAMALAKAKLQVHLAAIAYNFKRYWRLQIA